MGTSLVEVYNLALSACGSDASVESPDEVSREAHLCTLWLPTVRKHIISTAPWSSAMKHAKMTLLAERGGEDWTELSPVPGYEYSYHTPQDLILPYHLHSFMPFFYRGESLSTSDADPILFYLSDLPEPIDWDSSLVQAITHYLAARIARPLTGNAEVVRENFEIATFHVEAAKAQAAELLPATNIETLPDWITARGYSSQPITRFFWPTSILNPVPA